MNLNLLMRVAAIICFILAIFIKEWREELIAAGLALWCGSTIA